MIPPSDREDILCAMFESFCITVIRNFSRNLKRAMKNRQKHDGAGKEPVEYFAGLLSTEDRYASEQFVLEVDGLPCVLENELLYNALQSLSDQERQVVLYDFWYDCKEKEISCRKIHSESICSRAGQRQQKGAYVKCRERKVTPMR